MNPNIHDYVIVGAGVYGLCTAFFLAETGAQVVLLEKYEVGHSHGSSHGTSRISRSTYKNYFYRDLNALGLKTYWPMLEEKLGVKLVEPTPFLSFFDHPDIYASFYKIAKELHGENSFLTAEELRAKYPHMPSVQSPHKAIIDYDAALVYAEELLSALKKYLLSCKNVQFRENAEVTSIREDAEKVEISLRFEVQKIFAKKALITAGRWLQKLVPEIADLLTVVKQYTGFIELEDLDNYKVGSIPCFAHKKKGINHFYLPSINNEGFKIGMHNLREDNMTSAEFERILNAEGVLLFGKKFTGIKKIEECFYTVTRTEDFIIDWANPSKERVLVASCCSGHGFKFGPVLGKVISDILTRNESLDLYEKYKHLLKISYHRGVNLIE